jgi:hypothetical protein
MRGGKLDLTQALGSPLNRCIPLDFSFHFGDALTQRQIADTARRSKRLIVANCGPISGQQRDFLTRIFVASLLDGGAAQRSPFGKTDFHSPQFSPCSPLGSFFLVELRES